MSEFNTQWFQQVCEEANFESAEGSSYSANATPISLYETPLARRSPSYPEGFEATAAVYSSGWDQIQAHSQSHSPSVVHPTQPQLQDYPLESTSLSSHTQDDWSQNYHLPNHHPRTPTAVPSLHDAMSTISHDSFQSTPEIETLTQTDLQIPATEAYESSPENTRVLHHWVQVGTVTTSRSIKQFIVDDSTPERKLFYCAWEGCNHPLGFQNKSQLMTHVRSLHLQERPFMCTTCGTLFARKQDAIRHVNTANSGKRYECEICGKSFARKSYRDSHQNLCVERRALVSARRSYADGYQNRRVFVASTPSSPASRTT